jgi:LmbE family N-acetylglucosaminyl deacetylase
MTQASTLDTASLSGFRASLLPHRTAWPRLLLVMAHPDDEYALAATTYRVTRELAGLADHVVITNGEGGYRYASLAQTVYGVSIAREPDGRANLSAIRRQETVNAGRILGIRRQHFLEQPDPGFAGRCADAESKQWDSTFLRRSLAAVLSEQDYDFAFTLLPRPDGHGHHRAAAELLLDAVAELPEPRRPVVLGVEAGRIGEPAPPFAGFGAYPAAGTFPAFVFDRNARFGHEGALNYQIVANWVVAEHKSQGLFQTDCGKYDAERFWVFSTAPGVLDRAHVLARKLLDRNAALIEGLDQAGAL